jgi:ferrous iron transport protein B
VGELLSHDRPLVVALNMTDLAKRRSVVVDAAALSQRLRVPVVPIVASKGAGLDALRAAIDEVLIRGVAGERPADLPRADLTVETLTTWGDKICAEVVTGSGQTGDDIDSTTERLDHILTHPVYGTIAFVGVMAGLFLALFEFARLPMALIDATFAQLSTLVTRFLADGPIRELLIDGIIGGIAGTVVFLPQICLLFFLITLLEDTGYLARAAFVNDRFFQRFGLPGQAFVPLLTSHACALPGIMGTRLIPDRRDRLATILVAPFMSCSARLPVYVLLTGLLFANRPALAAVAFAGCYILGAAAAFLTALLFGKTILPGRARPMVLELPTYRPPSLMNALLTAKDQGLAFLKTAGTVIIAICIVMWWLGAYPHVGPSAEVQTLRAQASQPALAPEASQAFLDRADALQAKAQQAGSFAGRIGRKIEPVFRPLGYDWHLTVGILTSFLAREVFVSTMSVLATGKKAKEGVLEQVSTMTRDDGRPVFTRATSASALIFFVLAMQCLATLTVTRKETGSIKYAALQFGYMSVVAYVSAFVVYQTLRAVGVS